MAIKIIAALSANGVIGNNGDIPWKLPDDMKWFKEKTGHDPVVMGRKTYFSLPPRFRPLPNRTNIVLSRKPESFNEEGVVVTNDFLEAISLGNTQNVWVIGGAEIYQMALPHTEEMYLTRVEAEVDGDTLFPQWNSEEWTLVSREVHPMDAKHLHQFAWEIYSRR